MKKLAVKNIQKQMKKLEILNQELIKKNFDQENTIRKKDNQEERIMRELRRKENQINKVYQQLEEKEHILNYQKRIIAELKSEKTELKNKIWEQEHTIKINANTFDFAQQKLKILQLKHKNLLEEFRQERINWNTQNYEEVYSLKTKLQEKSQELNEQIQNLQAKKYQEEAQHKEIRKLTQEMDGSKQEIKKLLSQIENLEELLTQKEEKMDWHNMSAEKNRKLIVELQKELREAKAAFETERDSFILEIEEINVKLFDLEHLKQTWEEEKIALQKKCKILENSCKILKAKNKHAESGILKEWMIKKSLLLSNRFAMKSSILCEMSNRSEISDVEEEDLEKPQDYLMVNKKDLLKMGSQIENLKEKHFNDQNLEKKIQDLIASENEHINKISEIDKSIGKR
jgi:predicted  nucleic acid-binding Zn-ribbon protein